YPAVNWNRSYTLYLKELEEWFSTHAPAGWTERRRALVELLQRDAELQEVVQLVGPDALQDAQRLVLETARLVREVFLQQNAFSDADAYSSLPKTSGLLEAVLAFYQAAREALEKGMVLSDILRLPLREDIARLRDVSREKFEEARAEVMKRLEHQFSNLVTQRSE
ncbi:MAG TPA: V-type ATP synthase subunit A, partial [Candidatus Hydrogenedentes bacterium]|nr:V-type ATP synthase subunit A [Candidatus Hydrogenedentota bacterium]